MLVPANSPIPMSKHRVALDIMSEGIHQADTIYEGVDFAILFLLDFVPSPAFSFLETHTPFR
jgi:hypothetical protein